MDDSGVTPRFDGIGNAIRKKRSQTFRRPRPDDDLPMSTTAPSDDADKASSDENFGCDSNSGRKEYSLNQCVSRVSFEPSVEGEKPVMDRKDGGFKSFYNSEPRQGGLIGKRSSEGVLSPANLKSTSVMKDDHESESRSADVFSGRNDESLSSKVSGVTVEGSANENKVKKVKLKVGGVTRTIQANSTSNGVSGFGEYSSKSSRSSETSTPQHKPNLQANSDDNTSSSDKRNGLQGIPWKDFSRVGFSLGKGSDSLMGRTSAKNASSKEVDRSEPARKSKRVPKRRVLDRDFSDDDEDDEIRYLEKLKISKASAGSKDDNEESGKKHRKLSLVSNIDNVGASRSGKDGKKKSRSDRVSGDSDYAEEEDSASDGELDGKKKNGTPRKEAIDSSVEGKREITLTSRQRALQSGKDASATLGASLIEFPNGLPPAPPRKQKEKLSEVEQQLKKSEAAQKRKMQVEKAAREMEEEAIRKILGQDSSRKKREDKIKKRQEELAQEKAANARLHASSTVRIKMDSTGNTTVTFPNEMGIPDILNQKPVSYPPPREKCVGPGCTNPYKYRDSKMNVPLCCLQCYKAVQGKTATEIYKAKNEEINGGSGEQAC
ncbi:hypothetical protein UlMin_030771 [Ulmus minor]